MVEEESGGLGEGVRGFEEFYHRETGSHLKDSSWRTKQAGLVQKQGSVGLRRHKAWSTAVALYVDLN